MNNHWSAGTQASCKGRGIIPDVNESAKYTAPAIQQSGV